MPPDIAKSRWGDKITPDRDPLGSRVSPNTHTPAGSICSLSSVNGLDLDPQNYPGAERQSGSCRPSLLGVSRPAAPGACWNAASQVPWREEPRPSTPERPPMSGERSLRVRSPLHQLVCARKSSQSTAWLENRRVRGLIVPSSQCKS